MSHIHDHRQHRVGCLWAAVLGANDGIAGVSFWGSLAMVTTALVGIIFDVAVS